MTLITALHCLAVALCSVVVSNVVTDVDLKRGYGRAEVTRFCHNVSEKHCYCSCSAATFLAKWKQV